jgi:hypothetical protein
MLAPCTQAVMPLIRGESNGSLWKMVLELSRAQPYRNYTRIIFFMWPLMVHSSSMSIASRGEQSLGKTVVVNGRMQCCVGGVRLRVSARGPPRVDARGPG